MSAELTNSQVNRLGDRLRKGQPRVADLEILDVYRRSFDEAHQLVIRALRNFGLEPSGRIKTTISIVEKLKRESIRLSKLQDIAGCRVVVNDIANQDRVVGLIVEAFPKASVIDRRQKHSHGYRAMHVVADVNGTLVEIQVRTQLQHLWAVWSEALADALDQSIKYGGGPKEIQEILSLESEIVALMESIEEMLTARFGMLDRGKELRPLRDLLSGRSLPSAVLDAMALVGDMKDLIRGEQEVKERLTREILKLKGQRRNP